MTQVSISRVRIDSPDAALLIEAVQQEYVVRYGGRDESPIDPEEFEGAQGAFYLARLDGVAVASGAWRVRDDAPAFGRRRTAELKRMYVVPGWQRRGLARRMLAHLEQQIADAGLEVVVLETGTTQPEAIALYESSGYERIDNFGYYRCEPDSVCFGRLL